MIKKTVLVLCSLLLAAAFTAGQEKKKPRYAAVLIPPKPVGKPGEDASAVRADCEVAYTEVMHLLKKRCRFFDQERRKQRVQEFYRENPDLDPTSLRNRMKLEQGVERLLIIIELSVESIKDEGFPFYWHVADMALRVVDKRGSSEIYAMAKGQTQKILKAPHDLTDPRDAEKWKNNRLSRDEAIKWAAKKLAPQLIAEMEKKQESIQAFDFFAVRLTNEQEKALRRLLDELSREEALETKVTDIKDSTDSGISAKVNCAGGIHAFMDYLTERFFDYIELEYMVCDTDGFVVKVYEEE